MCVWGCVYKYIIIYVKICNFAFCPEIKTEISGRILQYKLLDNLSIALNGKKGLGLSFYFFHFQ